MLCLYSNIRKYEIQFLTVLNQHKRCPKTPFSFGISGHLLIQYSYCVLRTTTHLPLRNRLKIRHSMLAQRADKVFRQFIAFIDITADLADKSFLSFGLWFRFYIILIVSLGHRFYIRDHTGFCNTADEHSMCIQIYILFYL